MIIPKSKPLMVPVPKETTFHIPEGRYRAIIKSIKQMLAERHNDQVDNVRFLFDVNVPSMPATNNLAKAEFKMDLNPGSELRNVLTKLLGKEAITQAAGGVFDLEQLVDMEVEIEIEHVITSRRDEYAYPLVRVVNIQKPGTMILTGSQEVKP